MSKKDPIDYEIEQGLRRLTKAQKIMFYVELLIWYAFYHFREILLRTRLGHRARVHWIGHHRRPQRLERALGLFVFCGGLLFLEWREYMIWAAGWGTLASAFVIWRSVRILAPRPRRQYHWAGE